MEKFLKRIQEDLDNKIMSAIKGESIIKPFTQEYDHVREKKPKQVSKTKIYDDEQESLYSDVIKNFLMEHPELLEK